MESQSIWEQAVDTFLSAFWYPGLDWKAMVLAIGLGLVFGAGWLIAYRTPAAGRRRALLGVAAVSALGTWAAISFVQLPLAVWLEGLFVGIWGEPTVASWALVAGIPLVLISGIVQEAAKLVPVIVYRSRDRARLDARSVLLVGAIAGAGFGVFEAIWVFNSMFAADPGWTTLREHGLEALLPFSERLFAVGFHVAASAIAAYGLATGKGIRFYLVAACLHGALNYSVVLIGAGVLGGYLFELYVAAFGVATTVMALRLGRAGRRGEAAGALRASSQVTGLGEPF